MKKYFLIATLGLASLAFSQNYPYQNNYPYGQQQSGWYGDDDYYDDEFYNYAYSNFPDDYYYDFPTDYYPSSYYKSYYNEYRRSITDIDWNWIFSEYNLSDYQIRQIIALNRRFISFSAWNSYYGMNPDRWYYDRFYALERILGPRIIVVIQNRYYNGYSPIRYYQNYRHSYYQPRYSVMPQYRYVNVNQFRVDRGQYFERQPAFRSSRSNSGWGNTNQGILREGTRNGVDSNYKNENSGFRRNNDSFGTINRQSNSNATDNGWRSSSRDSGSSSDNVMRRESSSDGQNGWRAGARDSVQRGSGRASDRGNEAGLRSGGRSGGYR